MNASIDEDYKKMANAQVATKGSITKIGTCHGVSGHGSGSKPGKAPGELREPTKATPGSGASKAGMKAMKTKQY
jgi:hypothetical protein